MLYQQPPAHVVNRHFAVDERSSGSDPTTSYQTAPETQRHGYEPSQQVQPWGLESSVRSDQTSLGMGITELESWKNRMSTEFGEVAFGESRDSDRGNILHSRSRLQSATARFCGRGGDHIATARRVFLVAVRCTLRDLQASILPSVRRWSVLRLLITVMLKLDAPPPPLSCRSATTGDMALDGSNFNQFLLCTLCAVVSRREGLSHKAGLAYQVERFHRQPTISAARLFPRRVTSAACPSSDGTSSTRRILDSSRVRGRPLGVTLVSSISPRPNCYYKPRWTR
jgi:hypothetical protein